jgi:hypothetical protein
VLGVVAFVIVCYWAGRITGKMKNKKSPNGNN